MEPLLLGIWLCACLLEDSINEYLLNPSSSGKGWFLWLIAVCALLWNIWGREIIEFLGVWRGALVSFGPWCGFTFLFVL